MEKATLLQTPHRHVRAARPEGWEIRLGETLVRYSEAKFEWGTTDCFTLCADVVRSVLLEDRLGHWRDYASREDGQQLLADNKFKDIGDAFATLFDEIHPSIAQRGDIGRAHYPGAKMGGGVVFIGHEVVGKGEFGLMRLPITAVQRAFQVI